MKTFLFVCCFLVLQITVAYDIHSRPISTTYDEFGAFQSFKLQWRSDVTVCSHCLIRVTLPQHIHQPATPLQFTLIDQTGLLLVEKVSSLIPTSNVYFFTAGLDLEKNIWYTFEIFAPVAPTMVYGLVGIAIVAGTSATDIVYLSNNAYEYYHLETIALPPLNILIAPISQSQTIAGKFYPFSVTFNASFSTSEPITLVFSFTNQNYSLLSPATPLQQNNNFQFTGPCQLLCDSISCIHPLYCQINNNQLFLALPYLDSLNHTIEFTVANPNFVDLTGLAILATGDDGVAKGIGIANGLFSVSAISIIASGVNLHWGIPLATVVSQMGLGLFVGGGWNSIDIGFTVSEVSMISSQFVLILYVGASYVLEQSIDTNLPKLNGSIAPRCVYTFPSIVCQPIDAFTSKNTRYFIKFKASFLAADNFANLGSISINIVGDNSIFLFTPLTHNLGIPAILWNDYHDYSGFHSPSYKISETQILSIPDTGLVNSTSSFMNNLFTKSAFVGIDPDIPNQQLTFLLKTLPTQMSFPLITNQTYQTKIYFNSKVFKYVNPEGIDVSAYSQSTNSYRQDAVSCYINSSTSPTIQIYQCQAHNDYVYGQQLDNIYMQTNDFGLFSFVCGNGSVVVCPGGTSCAESCRLFKGKGTTQGSSGVLSIRNVTFIDNYQSSLLAGDKVLDFIIAFYHGGTLVSASLINAYTVKNTRLQQMTPKLYNTYLSSTQTNDGKRLPTLLGLQGHLTINEMSNNQYTQFMVFLPNEIAVNRFIESNGRVGCTHVCSSYQITSASKRCKDNWLCKQGILVENIQNTNTLIDIKIPIQIFETVLGSIDIAFLINSSIDKIYRLNGSAITQMMSPTQLSLISSITYANSWSNPDYWVKTASDVYKQGIKLDLIAPFSSSITIDMLGSLLTFTGQPTFTFAAAYQSIFSLYSTAIANNVVNCNLPFTYYVNQLYNVSILWCQLSSGGQNQINISYPYFSSQLGSGFPFQTTLSYGLSDGNGQMVAYRTESNAKTLRNTCITSISNVYNYAEVTKQSILLSVTIQPFLLSADSYNSLQIALVTPVNIPLSFLTCECSQILLSQVLVCTVVSFTSNRAILQINAASLNSIKITNLQIALWVVSAGAATVTVGIMYTYSIQIITPQTDSLGTSSQFYGVKYSPFSGTTQVCSNLLSLSNLNPINQNILVSNITVSGIALNYYSQLSFDVQFSNSRTVLLPTSSITIQFTNLLTTFKTSCLFWTPQRYPFLKELLSSNTVSFTSYDQILAFASNSYNIVCKNIQLSQNLISLKVSWLDGANVLQQSVVMSYTANLPSSSSITGSITGKMYNTLGYSAEFILNIAQATILNDYVQIWFDASSYRIHSLALQCHALVGGIKTQVYCAEDYNERVHLYFTATAGASITIWIYGIEQDSIISSAFKTIVSINELSFFICNIAQNLSPNVLSAAPIILKSQNVDANYCLNIIFAFPISYSSSFYLLLDDFFMLTQPQIITCFVNTISVPCLRNAPNVIFVVSTVVFAAAIDNTLQICQMIPTKLDQYDPNQLNFKIFTVAGSSLSIGSHQHLSSTYLIVQLPPFPTKLSYWYEDTSNISWAYHTIYIGYFKKSINLSPVNHSLFSETIPLNYISQKGLVYMNSPGIIDLGTNKWTVDIAAINYADSNKIDYLVYSHLSTSYSALPYLNLFISSDKCKINAEYLIYETYPSGITIPILFDFSDCRPASTHILSYSVSTPDLIVDTSFSNFKVNSTYPKAYVLLRQSPTNNLLTGLFTLTATLSGTYSSSYFALPSISVKVNSGTILQVPQTLQPTINQLSSNSIDLTVQCNQASTIYWAVGLDPTILGLTVSELQAQLTNSQQGLKYRVYDPYSWSEEIYGFTYEPSPNKNVPVSISGLRGSSNYLFKYFCVNQLGFQSGGKILPFTTPYSQYQLSKVTFGLSSPLSINQSNSLACVLSEFLITGYPSVITSTFSNCINVSYTFFATPSTTYYDEYANNLYYYHFYVDSFTIPASTIRNKIPSELTTYPSFISLLVPYTTVDIKSLTNNYDPIVKQKYFTASVDQITCTIDVGEADSYLVAAYMNLTFDPQTMTLPSAHMIKLGNFSAASQFNQVYMKYGRNNITIDVLGLQQYQNYSIFYFVTVDNSAINSKHTSVYFQNVQTTTYVYYDLWQSTASILAILFILALL